MNNNRENIYDINSYTDPELLDILDLNSPSDRELEARIIFLIKKYENMQNQSGNQLANFFNDIYKHFFDIDDSDDDNNNEYEYYDDKMENNLIEGFDNTQLDAIDEKVINQKQNQTPPQNQIFKQLTNTTDIGYTKTLNYTPDKLNPLLQETIKRIISIDSQYRENKRSLSTEFTFNLSEPLKDVVSLKLYSIQIPYTWYTISNNYGSNIFYLKGNSPGINNGNHDISINILSGNYSPSELITAINNGIQKIKNDLTDISFGNTNIEYNNITSLSTINIDLKKIYNESSYYLNFPYWTDILNDNNSRLKSIPSYLGFDNKDNYPCIVKSLYTKINIDDYLNAFYINNDNNYFTIIKYHGPNNYIEGVSVVDISFNIFLSKTGIINRNDLIIDLNNQIASNKYLNSESSIVKVDINDELNNNFGKSYFQLKIKANRYTTNNFINSKIVVIFPTETLTNGYLKIWTGLNSCFSFENTINETNKIISNKSPVLFFDTTKKNSFSETYIDFKCIKPYYDNAENNIYIKIPNGDNTIIEYIEKVNNILNNTTNVFGPGTKIELINGYININFNINKSVLQYSKLPITDGSNNYSMNDWKYILTSIDDEKIITAITNNHIYKYNDNGNNWSKIDNITSGSLNSISMSYNGQYQTILDSSFIYISSNYGNNWGKIEGIPQNNWQSVKMSLHGSYQLVIDSSNGYVYRSTNYGNNWGKIEEIPQNNWKTISISYLNNDVSGQIQYVFGDNTQNSYKTTNYGNNWIPIENSKRNWKKIEISPDGKYIVAIVDDIDYIYISNDYGQSWKLKKNREQWVDITLSYDSQTILITNGNEIYISNDSGSNWNFLLPTINLTNLSNLFITKNKEIYVYSSVNNDYIYKYSTSLLNNNDYNVQFKYNNEENSSNETVTPIDISLNNIDNNDFNKFEYDISYINIQNNTSQINRLNISNNKKYITAISNNNVYVSSNYGNNWSTNIVIQNFINLVSIKMSTTGQYQFITIPYTTYISISTSYGVNWSNQNISNIPSKSFEISSDGRYILTINQNSNNIFISNNYGISWVEKTIINNYNSNLIWNSAALSGDGQYQYIVGKNLFYGSNDRGETWSVINSLEKNWSNVLTSSDGKYITAIREINNNIFSDVDYIYISNDYGKNWMTKGGLRQWDLISMTPNGIVKIASVKNSNIIYISFNYGFEWSILTTISNPINDILLSNDNEIFVCNNNDNNINYFIRNKSFEEQKYAINKWKSFAISFDETYQTAVANNMILVSINKGISWNIKGYMYNWNSIKMSKNGKYQTAITINENVYNSSNYGITWFPIFDNNNNWSSLSMSNTGQYQIVTAYDDFIYVSSNYGNNWDIPLNYSKKWTSTTMTSEGDIQYATTDDINDSDSNIYISTNYGVNWNPIISVSLNIIKFKHIKISNIGKYISAIGDKNNTIYISKDYGTNWNEVKIDIDNNSLLFNSVIMTDSGANQYLISSQNNSGYIFESDDYGDTWKKREIDVFKKYNINNYTDIYLSYNNKKYILNNNDYIYELNDLYLTSPWYKYLNIDKNLISSPYNINNNIEELIIKNNISFLIKSQKYENNLIEIKENINDEINIIPYVEGVIDSYNIINIKITSGQYNPYQLISEINNKIQNNSNIEILGTNFEFKIINGEEKTIINLNINKIYSGKDYRLVFYDPYSFVKCFVGSSSVKNTTWDTTLGWVLGFRLNTEYILSEYANNDTDIITVVGDTGLSINLFNYFMICLDDYNQNHLNDGLITVTSKDTDTELPSYAKRNNIQCTPIKNTSVYNTTIKNNNNLLTEKQLYSIRQIVNEKNSLNEITADNTIIRSKNYGSGPFVKDIFGLIPLKLSGLQNGSTYVEFGGTLQNQERLYFGPVNIQRISVKLISDRGDIVDLNGANWSFSLVCEQLYKQQPNSGGK
jgi:photosystem II stability/assembly factor-like uncharacterized protein